MPRTLKVAAVQMDATPAPTADRLARAETLVADAARAGAQVVALPEVFNTGYEYHERNYGLAEPLDGATVTWMKQAAAQHRVYVAGTLLLLDADEVYNSALLVAPDGRLWRYDKNYPFNWERAYFREGRGVTVADTEFGKIGMLICWDAAHPDLFARYAGKVDALLHLSCPPNLYSADVVFPDGTRANAAGTLLGGAALEDVHFQGRGLSEQAAWLGVPVVSSIGAGQFRTHLPLPYASVGGLLLLARADLGDKLKYAPDVLLEADFAHLARVLDAQGGELARVTVDGDGFALADITLADATPVPQGAQPRSTTPEALRLLNDLLGPSMMIPLYRQGVRRQWGAHMAPVDTRTKYWAAGLAGAALLGFLMGRSSK